MSSLYPYVQPAPFAKPLLFALLPVTRFAMHRNYASRVISRSYAELPAAPQLIFAHDVALISCLYTDRFSCKHEICLCISMAELLINELQYADVRQIPVLLIIIQAIANHEFIRNGKAGIIHMYLFLHPALRLVKKGTQVDALWSSLF